MSVDPEFEPWECRCGIVWTNEVEAEAHMDMLYADESDDA